jgi:outer membrane protein TolC
MATSTKKNKTTSKICNDTNKVTRITGGTLTAILAAAVVGCSSDIPFDPRAEQRTEREAAREVKPTPLRPLPTTLESSFLPPRPGEAPRPKPTTPPATGPSLAERQRVRMNLQDVIHRAVLNNLDVKVAGYGPGIEASRTIEAEARFDPTLFANFNFERRDRTLAFNTATSSNGVDQEKIITYQSGVRQNLESGGQVELRYESIRTNVRQSSGGFGGVDPNPFTENQLVLQLTQPLLQNFGYEVNRARITIGRNNQRISVLDFRKQLEETTSDIERTYWQLAQAERDLRIAEELLNNTLRTADILLKRLGQDVTRVQISQANASVETRRSALIRAKAQVEQLSNQLKRLMNDPEYPVTGATIILPGDMPIEEPFRFDLADEIATAMQNRFELGQQQLRIDSANIASNVAKNNELPTLNLVGQVGYQGLDEDFSKAFHNQMEFNNLNYQIGLQFEWPIGYRAARAVTRRARYQQMQAIDQYRNLIDQVSLDVKNALLEVDTTWTEMVARRQARFAQADSLAAIEQREAGGEALTPTFVNLKLQTQEQLADAARAETEAVANYNIAISRLELAKGTLLRYNNVIMEEAESRMVTR